jgi:hypothetical protein
MTRADPIGGLLQRWQLLVPPLRFALLFEAVVVVVYIPAAFIVSVLNRGELEIPIWKDYMWPLFQIAWVALAWAYARQPAMITDSLATGAGVIDRPHALGRWTSIVASRWLPLGLGSLLASGVFAVLLRLIPEPALYSDFYWHEPVFFYLIFSPLMALLFYFGLMVAGRQSIAGLILTMALLRYRPPQPLSHEAAIRLIRELLALGSSLTRQVAPWVILGAWLVIWLTVAVLQDTFDNAVLYAIAGIYVPGLFASLLLPLLALTISLRRIKRDQIRRLEEQIEAEYGSALGKLPNLEAMAPHNSKIRDLQQLVTLTNLYFPAVPVASIRLRVVAGGAVFQVVIFWVGLFLDMTSLASLAGI